MLATILTLALALWPFGPASPLNQRHSARYHARRLAHLQQARAQRLAKCHGAGHPSLIHR